MKSLLEPVGSPSQLSKYPNLIGPSKSSAGPWDVLNIVPAAVYACSADGAIQQFNTRAAELWGRAPNLGEPEERFCGSHRLYRLDGGPLPHDQCPMAEVLRTGTPVVDQKVVIERTDGTRIIALVNIRPITDPGGTVVGAVNCFLDISERMERAHEREAAGAPIDTESKDVELIKQRLASIVETSADAIVSKNLDGIIMSWNGGAQRIFGYTAEEAIGRPVLMLIPDDRHDEETLILARLRRGERIEHYETKRCRKDGTVIDVSLTVSPLYSSDGVIIGASKIARDISARKEAEARQELLNRELQHRTKNMYSVIQSVVTRSLAGKTDIKEAEETLRSRLQTLAQTHTMLLRNDWHGADLAEIAHLETSAYSDRITIEGPSLPLNARAAQNFGLALHELATNAAKYGALSNKTGQVVLRWSITIAEGGPWFTFQWHEMGGAPVTPPVVNGFGSVVLHRVMAEHFDTPPKSEFDARGLRYELTGALEGIAASASEPAPQSGAEPDRSRTD